MVSGVYLELFLDFLMTSIKVRTPGQVIWYQE